MMVIGFGSVSTFTDNFTTTQNPLTTPWKSPDNLQTPCHVSASGRCHGTMLSGGSLTSTYDDSSAYIEGFGNQHEVEATIFINGATDNDEVEMLVMWRGDYSTRSTAFGDTHSNGYEWNLHWQGSYQNVGRFKGAALDSTAPDFTPATGDKMRFRATLESGNVRLQAYYRPVSTGIETLKINVLDSDAGLKIVSGHPGIGFYTRNQTPGQSNRFGFSSVTLRAI